KAREALAGAQQQATLAKERQQHAERLAEESRRRALAVPFIGRAAIARAQGFHQGAALYLVHAMQHTDDMALRAQWAEDLQQALVPVATSPRGVHCGSLAYSLDGRLLATGDFAGLSAIRIWRTTDGVQLQTLRGHKGGPELSSNIGGLAF